MKRWTILALLLFATACCSKAEAPESSAPAVETAEDSQDDKDAPAGQPEPDAAPAPTSAPGETPTDKVEVNPAAEQGKKPAVDGEKEAPPANGAASPDGAGYGTGSGRLEGDKGAPDGAKRKKPAQGGDKKYREDFGVE